MTAPPSLDRAAGTTGTTPAGPVAPTASAVVRLRPLPLGAGRIDGGFWGRRQDVNRAVSIPSGGRRLREAGNLDDLAAAARGEHGADAYTGPLFMDSDVYKWLEAVAWEQGREPSADLAREQHEVTATIAAAQAGDGYLNSFVQVVTGQRFVDLPWSHELYCAGHLVQAAVAAQRATGDEVLMGVATRFAGFLERTFGTGEGRLDDVDGHPVVEMALVELYRQDGRREHLDLARYTVQARGRGLVAAHGPEPTYFSDRVPVREATTVEGHAVRAVYLAAGATDLAVETGDGELLAALARQWRSMVETKAYLTGGVGSRWEGEAFGDPYELPPDRAYAESCAAIGSVQWSWRMLLATGEARYADQVERTLFNGVLPGVSLDGESFFYVNALQVRDDAHGDDPREPAFGRRPWFSTACCPPNIMRTLAQLDTYLATSDEDGVQLHQYAGGAVRAEVGGGTAELAVTTRYPWDGEVAVEVVQAPDAPWTLSLRVPAWAQGARLEGPDGTAEPVEPGAYARVRRTWSAGDRVVLHLPMAPRLTRPHPRVDAVRGCVAIERGPLVHCLEERDQGGAVLDDLRLDPSAPLVAEHLPDLLGGVTVVRASATDGRALTAVPYLAWANRGTGPMRVWVPLAEAPWT